MGWLKHLLRDREFERYVADELAFDEGDQYTRIMIRMRQNVDAVIKELRFIRYILLFLLIIALSVVNKLLPNWWRLW